MTSSNETILEKNWFDLQFNDIDREHIKKPEDIKVDIKRDYPQSTIKDEIIDRIKGSIFGMALGDALGAHVEFRPQTYLKANPVKDLQGGGTWGLEKGQFTDDTSMALCLANSLIACHDFIPYDQLVRYKWWYRYGYMSSTGHCFDIGAATRQSIQEFELRQRNFSQDNHISLDKMDNLSSIDSLQGFDVNCSKDGVAGNGALMRLAPVPLFFYGNPLKAIEYSGISAQITHGDKKASDACRYYGALIVATLNGEKKNDLFDSKFYDNHKKWFGNESLHVDIMNIVKGSFKKKGGYDEGIRGKGYVINALEAALWAFWSDEDSFEKGVLNAVNLGDDTDTTAAIYGQLAGVYYGFNLLPKKWCDVIYAKDFISYVSHAIAYEGQKWFDRTMTTETLINSNPTTDNNNTINSKNKSSLININRLSTMNSIMNNTMDIIQRKAINPLGCIGSFYNASIDSIQDSLEICINSKVNERLLLRRCFVKRGDEIESENLLRFLDFDDQLRLSLVSGIVSPEGISLIMTYPYLIDEFTRIIYYSSITRETSLIDPINHIHEQSIYKSEMTHLITQIHSGIDIIIILRLPTNQIDLIDNALKKMCQCLTDNTKLMDKYPIFDQIISTYIYSNIPFLSEQKRLIDVYQSIFSIKDKFDKHCPSTYILYPLKEFYPLSDVMICTLIQPKLSHKIEQHLFRLSNVKKIWSTILDPNTLNILNKYLKEQLNEQEQQLKILLNHYENEKKRLKIIISQIRQRKLTQQINQEDILSENIQTTLKHMIDDLQFDLNNLKSKAHFIQDLETRGFTYSNANNYNIQHGDDHNTIQHKIIKERRERILCSNDHLNENNSKRLNQLSTHMINERKTNEHLNLVYLDFSYSSYELDQIIIYPSDYFPRNLLKENQSFISNQRQSFSQDQTINILLLGKSGVGKSTLINTFESYIQSKKTSNRFISKTIISFMCFIENEIDGHFIRIGQYDPNEDYHHHHPGQSITQQCRSYLFHLDNGTKIRLIDTPGFNDSRGENQDQLNMQYILSRITHFTYLNAICLIIDSNDTNLQSYDRYLTQLLHFLGDNAIENIAFCFTKTLNCPFNIEQRNNQLKSIKNISIHEENTFDFDSTFFIQSAREHYLTRLFNRQDNIYQNSLSISNNGWNQLLNNIQTYFHPYLIYQSLQKVEYFILEMKQLIRPILETIKNILTNQILQNTSIILDPKPLLHHSAICYSCDTTSIQYGTFWIINRPLHHYSNTCSTCSCPSNEHLTIDYRLEYLHSNDQSKQMSHELKELIHAIPYFGYYLKKTNSFTSNDLLLSYLNRMIDEETLITDNKSFSNFNSKLHNQLVKVKHEYQFQMNIIPHKDHHDDWIFIDQLIQSIQQIPIVRKQLNVAQQIQEITL